MSDDATPGTSGSGSTPADGPSNAGTPETPEAGTTPPPFQPGRTVQRPATPPAPAGQGGVQPPAPPATHTDPMGDDVPAGAVLTDPVPDPAGGGAGDDLPPPVAPDDTDDTDFPTHRTKAGTTAAVIAIGTGLLGAAATIGATRARADGDLDWSNYGVGIGATLALLVIAVLAAAGRADIGGRAREEAVTWPGVVGILGAVVMIGIGINENEAWVDYLLGAVLVVLALIGYLMARRGAFAVVAILGLGLIYGNVVDDVLGDTINDDNGVVIVAAALTVFVVVVSGLGWLLPSRALIGVVVGVIGVLGLAGMMAALLAMRFLSAMFAGFGGGPDMMPPAQVDSGFKESDVWWIIAFAAVLTVLWALAASITNHPGFSLLTIVMPTIIVPLATVVLAAEKPSLWAGILAAVGGVVLIGGVGLARLRGKKVLLGG